MEKYTLARWKQVKPGDRVKRILEAPALQARPGAMVYQRDFPHITLKITDAEGNVRMKKVEESPDSLVRVAVLQPCGKRCCERHHLERANQHAICADHWLAWEAVA